MAVGIGGTDHIRAALKKHIERVGMEGSGKGKVLAKQAGLNETAVRDLFSKTSSPRISTLLALAEALKISPATLTSGVIPVEGYITVTGEIEPLPKEDAGKIYVPLPPEVIGDCFAYRVKGDGLPGYRDGDTIYAVEGDFVGEECVVKTSDTGALLFRTVLRGTKDGRYHLVAPGSRISEDKQLDFAFVVHSVLRSRRVNGVDKSEEKLPQK